MAANGLRKAGGRGVYDKRLNFSASRKSAELIVIFLIRKLQPGIACGMIVFIYSEPFIAAFAPQAKRKGFTVP